MKRPFTIGILIASFVLSMMMQSCTDHTSKEVLEQKQLNISVMLDLSDRISPEIHPAKPEHADRDTAIVKELISFFKEDMNTLGKFNAKGRFRVFMEPAPAIPNIEALQDEMIVDCSSISDVQRKKDIYENMEGNIMTALSEIYSETNRIGKYTEGSDIWRFFKNDVDLCISNDTNYRNILVIITDGYIYGKETTQKHGNRVQNLTNSTIGKYRASADPISVMEKDDFGMMTCRNDLQNLEVIVLEVAPENNNQKDEDILKYCIEKWLKEMGVGHYAVYKSDLPAKTKARLRSFLH